MKNAAMLFSVFSAITSLFACSGTPVSATDNVSHPSHKVSRSHHLEAVYGFEVRSDELVFLLETTGCSDAGHFLLKIEPSKKQNSGNYSVSVKRIKPDRCKAMSRLQYVTFPLRESSLQKALPAKARVQLINPFSAPGKLKRQEPK